MMLRSTIMLGLATLTGGCDSRVEQPRLEPIFAAQAADARNAANQVVGANGQALIICGQSNGLGLFTLDWKSGFTSDGMKDGRLIFLIRDDGRADIYFRDAMRGYLSSLEEGADVQRISFPDRKIESWIVSYPSNGVVETHNITTAPSDGLVDLWTSNKPDSLIGASAKLFRSSCIRA
ncbi:hypothetical protein F1640_17585 [Novosphingobium sp. NBM11]|uniref:hypothetical protein n=1 Tax=Novosphingobium sp. NBM11 TaxID=2596914 RepID=UPI001891FC24|nr:hypothetical protein [Novosphingobium sp. NBM11]MBF5091775.1 hypothetical protein [Novosphingobium sp. NBM11]